MNQNQSYEQNIDCPLSLAKKHNIHKPWTLKTKSVACCQKSQIISCSVIHFLKIERAPKVCPMESSQKWDLPIFKAFIYSGEIEGHPGPKKKNKKYKLAPDPKRRKNIFFIGYILYPFQRKVPPTCPLSETS